MCEQKVLKKIILVRTEKCIILYIQNQCRKIRKDVINHGGLVRLILPGKEDRKC